MKIFVGQIYIEVGVTFPFSLRFQRWLGDALSERVETSGQFCARFGANFGLGLRISAKADIEQTEIRGPTVFKRDKDVEYTVFLPYKPNDYHDPGLASLVLLQILQSTVRVLQELDLNPQKVVGDMNYLQATFLNTPGLLKTRNPSAPNLLSSA